jgi:hypothetical protein
VTGSSRIWIRYLAIGLVTAVALSGIAASWLLALQAGNRARLERDVPAVLGSVVTVDASVQALLDQAATKLRSDPSPDDLAISPGLDDATTALLSLRSFVEQADQSGVAVASQDLERALDDNLRYVQQLKDATRVPVPQVDAGTFAGLDPSLDTLRGSFTNVFRRLNVSPDPFAPGSSFRLDPTPLGRAVLDLSERLRRDRTAYVRRLRTLTSHQQALETLYQRFAGPGGIRDFDSTNVLGQLEHVQTSTAVFDEATTLLNGTYQDRQALIGDIDTVAGDAPRGLQGLASDLGQIVRSSLDGITAAQTAVSEYETDQLFPSDCTFTDPFAITPTCTSLWTSIEQVPEWDTFQRVTAAVAAQLDDWQRRFQSASTTALAKLNPARKQLERFGIDVPKA